MSAEPTETHDVPWAMQLVVYRDRGRPAREVDVAEAAARAVVMLLGDERSAPGGPWHEAVRTWRDVQIRKLVRRADGKRWEDVQALPGVTVAQKAPTTAADEHGTAAVRAFVPAPVQPLPKQLHKLQVSGTQFPAVGASATQNAVVTVEVAPGLGISSGKLAAQCGHAAQLAWEAMPRAWSGGAQVTLVCVRSASCATPRNSRDRFPSLRARPNSSSGIRGREVATICDAVSETGRKTNRTRAPHDENVIPTEIRPPCASSSRKPSSACWAQARSTSLGSSETGTGTMSCPWPRAPYEVMV